MWHGTCDEAHLARVKQGLSAPKVSDLLTSLDAKGPDRTLQRFGAERDHRGPSGTMYFSLPDLGFTIGS